MRTGKTLKQISELKEQLEEGKTVIVAGLKSPEHYLSILGEGCTAEESFTTTPYDFMSRTGGGKIKTGYIFKKL